VGFADYLKSKFKTTDTLIKFGIELLGATAERLVRIAARDGIINPGWKLEWERYSQWMTTDFLAWRLAIVNEYNVPNICDARLRWPPRPEVNNPTSQNLDIAAANPITTTNSMVMVSYVGITSASLRKQIT